jgi:hypothetical protein
VAINGGSSKYVIRNPLSIPIRVETRKPTRMANHTGIWKFFMRIPKIKPVRATLEPTDKSMPPSRIMKVIPIAMVKLMETCCKMFSKLTGFRKFLLVMESMMHSARNAEAMPHVLLFDVMMVFRFFMPNSPYSAIFTYLSVPMAY